MTSYEVPLILFFAEVTLGTFQLLLGHARQESTARNLGIEVDDVNREKSLEAANAF